MFIVRRTVIGGGSGGRGGEGSGWGLQGGGAGRDRRALAKSRFPYAELADEPWGAKGSRRALANSCYYFFLSISRQMEGGGGLHKKANNRATNCRRRFGARIAAVVRNPSKRYVIEKKKSHTLNPDILSP